MFFKHFASKNQLPGLSVNGTLVENGCQISVQLSIRVFDYAMKLSTFTESLPIFIYLDVDLSAWLVSMEIFPKGNFISISHLRVQNNAHRKNITQNVRPQKHMQNPAKHLRSFM